LSAPERKEERKENERNTGTKEKNNERQRSIEKRE
jgi:hypothetical protein